MMTPDDRDGEEPGRGTAGYWSQPKWTPDEPPRPSHARRNGWLLGCGTGLFAVIAIVVALVLSAAELARPGMDLSSKIEQSSHGQVRSSTYQSNNGVGEFVVWLAADVPADGARDVACNVVRPTLKGTEFEGARFQIRDNRGWLVADQNTPCG